MAAINTVVDLGHGWRYRRRHRQFAAGERAVGRCARRARWRLQGDRRQCLGEGRRAGLRRAHLHRRGRYFGIRQAAAWRLAPCRAGCDGIGAGAGGCRYPRHRTRRRAGGRAVRHYRVADAKAKLGLPEVKLGLLPGAGGTQRLPRIVGAAKAVEMTTSGTPMGAKAALAAGLVDEIVEGDLTAGAVAFARKIVAEGRPLKKVRDDNSRLGGDAASLAPMFADVPQGERTQIRWLRSARSQYQVHRSRRRPALRRRHEGRTQRVHEADGRSAIGRPAPCVLRRTPGRQDRRAARRCAAVAGQDRSASSAPAPWAAASR